MKVRAFIGIGSNLGDRQEHCRAALGRLSLLPDTCVTDVSPFFETEPAEGAEGGLFLNAVAEVRTSLLARALLQHLQGIETALGRPPGHPMGKARTIDLDILLYGDAVISEPDLTIPHPRMAERRFVLVPLAALAPSLSHPLLKVTATELLRRLGPEPIGLLEQRQ